MTAVTPRRRMPRIGRLPLPRRMYTRIAMLVAVVLAGAIGFLWVRQSGLVAIRQVQINGLYGPQASSIRAALVNEALTMTTLDVDAGKLESAISGNANVAGMRISTHFPHALTIDVVEHVPVATVSDGGTQIPVDQSGLLLRGRTAAAGTLPVVPLSYAPGGDTLVTAGSRAALATLAAAPYRFLAEVANATWSSDHGVIVQLRDGPQAYFGSASDLTSKWTALVAVLADASSHGAQYIDVSDPSRPAAGVSASAANATTTAVSSTDSSGGQ